MPAARKARSTRVGPLFRRIAQGYLGLQTHGGNDRISYREIQVKEFQPSDLPVNTVAPSVSGSGLVSGSVLPSDPRSPCWQLQLLRRLP